jgi:hypothetical protein
MHHYQMSNTSLRIVFVSFLMLGGCVNVSSGQPPPMVLNVRSEGNECRVTVATGSNDLPPKFIRVDQPRLLQIARKGKSRRAIVVFDLDAQYKCIGASIITMQEAGLTVEVAGWDSR